MNKEILEKLNNYDVVVGIDEVGRGPIAGPVTVAAFGILKKDYVDVLERLLGITDSKKLTDKRRDFYAEIIRTLKKEGKILLKISSLSAQKIDEMGIVPCLQSCLDSALKKASKGFESEKVFVYLDGSLYAPESFDQQTIIKGDSKNWLIGTASVAAKVARDTQMKKLAETYPEYGFERHKGYGTKAHYENIREHGPSDIHRKTWIKL